MLLIEHALRFFRARFDAFSEQGPDQLSILFLILAIFAFLSSVLAYLLGFSFDLILSIRVIEVFFADPVCHARIRSSFLSVFDDFLSPRKDHLDEI